MPATDSVEDTPREYTAHTDRLRRNTATEYTKNTEVLRHLLTVFIRVYPCYLCLSVFIRGRLHPWPCSSVFFRGGPMSVAVHFRGPIRWTLSGNGRIREDWDRGGHGRRAPAARALRRGVRCLRAESAGAAAEDHMAIEERLISTSRGEIAWLEAGRGWPLVLLHGFPLSAAMWRPQLEAVPQGWRFIAPDFRGFGRTPLGSEPLSVAAQAADVGALMDALEIEEAIVGGLSMGGYVAFAMFRDEPGRITALVLADTRAPADSPEGRVGRARMRETLAQHGPRAVADQMLPKLLSPSASPALVAQVRAMIESADPQAIDAAIQSLLNRPDSTPDLPRISRGTLILVGED